MAVFTGVRVIQRSGDGKHVMSTSPVLTCMRVPSISRMRTASDTTQGL